jgi:hypothetical protein
MPKHRRRGSSQRAVRRVGIAAPSDRAKPARLSLIWRAGTIVAAGALVYANSVRGVFLFDDDYGIVRNQTIRDLTRLTVVLSPPRESPVAGRPLVNLSLAINYAAGGLDPTGYHLVNIALHLCCALLIFAIAGATLRTARLAPRFGARAHDLAFAIALLWVVHPMNSEVVDYTVQRTESMMAAAMLVTVYAASVAKPGVTTGIVAIVACAAGMACKETMVVAPLLVVLYDGTFLYPSYRDALRARWPVYGGLAAAWSVLAGLLATRPRSGSAGFGTDVTPWTYLLNQTQMLARYLRVSIWPRHLVLWYGPPKPLTLAAVWPAALAVTGLIAAVLWGIWRRHPAGFAGAWIFLTLAPTSSVVPIATEVGAERRGYLALAALIAVGTLTAWHVATTVIRRGGALDAATA